MMRLQRSALRKPQRAGIFKRALASRAQNARGVSILRYLAVGLPMLLFGITAAAADDASTCLQQTDVDPSARLEACERYISSGKARGMNLAIAHSNRATIFAKRRSYDRALEEQDAAVRIAPANALIRENRGSLHWQMGEYDEAIADFDEAIRLDPKRAETYSWRGASYLRKRDYDRAIVDFSTAIKLDPNGARFYAGRGEAYERKGNTTSAIADFEHALSLRPNLTAAYMGLDRLTPRPQESVRASPPAAQVSPPQPSPTPANVRQVLERRGILGIWSGNCGRIAASDNPYFVYRKIDEQSVQSDVMNGPAQRDTAGIIESAVELGATDLTITVTNHREKGGELRDVYTIRLESNRMRFVEFARDGIELIAGGRWTSVGVPLTDKSAPSFSKCE